MEGGEVKQLEEQKLSEEPKTTTNTHPEPVEEEFIPEPPEPKSVEVNMDSIPNLLESESDEEDEDDSLDEIDD